MASSSGYSLYNGMEEQNNVFLYEKWESLTFSAFMTIIKLAVPERTDSYYCNLINNMNFI